MKIYYKEPRKRLRLEGYDYSLEGCYFITVCVHNRESFFDNPHVVAMVEKYWRDIGRKFSEVLLDDYVIMPNHFHGIIQIVGANLCVGPGCKNESLPRIMKWFKSQTTNAYLRGIKDDGWPPFYGKLWQRGYHDRVIRSEDELNVLKAYIRENPIKWEEDSENPLNGKISGPTHGSAPTIGNINEDFNYLP